MMRGHTLKRFPAVRIPQQIRQATIVLAAIALITLSAQLAIPYQPVPLTFQTSTILLIAMLLSPKQACSAVAGYLCLGALGAPIFAQFAGGLPVLFGPTGGYLLGFLPATLLCSVITSKCHPTHFGSYLAIACFGTLIIFFCGVSMLAHFLGLPLAYQFGAQPFLFTESLKLLLLATVISLLTK